MRDEIICEEVSSIQVKGVAHPVTLFRALDLKSHEEWTNSLAHSAKYFSLFVDPKSMSEEERCQGSKVLSQAMDALKFT